MSDAPKPDVKMIVAFLLDETGSMMSVRDATISGFNEYVGTLALRNPNALMSLRLFSSEKFATVAQLTPLPLVAKLTYDSYAPGGGTPLYDSIARLIRETDDATAAIQPPPEILFVIMTDGEENSSREFNRDRIFALISEKQAKGWTFVYLGANQDAWAVGQSIGVHQARAITYDANPAGTRAVFNMMGDASDRYMQKRQKARAEMDFEAAKPAEDEEFFSDDDAAKLGKEKPQS